MRIGCQENCMCEDCTTYKDFWDNYFAQMRLEAEEYLRR
jgi:hypothetical protein